uniref:Uncharacterized protein n=1 Tax=Ascaris lumbricoides TaxID=6252 RepID=A0A9J2PD62_ASCLU
METSSPHLCSACPKFSQTLRDHVVSRTQDKPRSAFVSRPIDYGSLCRRMLLGTAHMVTTRRKRSPSSGTSEYPPLRVSIGALKQLENNASHASKTHYVLL